MNSLLDRIRLVMLFITNFIYTIYSLNIVKKKISNSLHTLDELDFVQKKNSKVVIIIEENNVYYDQQNEEDYFYDFMNQNYYHQNYSTDDFCFGLGLPSVNNLPFEKADPVLNHCNKMRACLYKKIENDYDYGYFIFIDDE